VARQVMVDFHFRSKVAVAEIADTRKNVKPEFKIAKLCLKNHPHRSKRLQLFARYWVIKTSSIREKCHQLAIDLQIMLSQCSKNKF